MEHSKGLWIFVVVLMTSCGAYKNLAPQKAMDQSNCAQDAGYSYSSAVLPKPLHEIEIDTAITTWFTQNSLHAANAIGVLDDLTEYVNVAKSYRRNPTIDTRISRLELLEKIEQRINLSSLEISAVASEMDCEEERVNQIANYLKRSEDEVETKLTVTAIVVGAAGTIASALLLNHHNEDADYIEVSSGIAETTLGVLILLNKRKVLFYHPRNALRDIWEGRETSSIFPSSVWYYLNYFNPAIPDAPSPRYRVVEGWMNFGQIESAKHDKKHHLIGLYFGAGGKYSTEQLYNRADMYDQLESQIKLMKQDLTSLSSELRSIK